MRCPHCNHPRVTLVDGRETCTWSEDWRHECEARAVLAIPHLFKRRQYLLDIDNKRGAKAGAQLRATMTKIWEQRPAVGGG